MEEKQVPPICSQLLHAMTAYTDSAVVYGVTQAIAPRDAPRIATALREMQRAYAKLSIVMIELQRKLDTLQEKDK